jgi:hypothetical protein
MLTAVDYTCPAKFSIGMGYVEPTRERSYATQPSRPLVAMLPQSPRNTFARANTRCSAARAGQCGRLR